MFGRRLWESIVLTVSGAMAPASAGDGTLGSEEVTVSRGEVDYGRIKWMMSRLVC